MDTEQHDSPTQRQPLKPGEQVVLSHDNGQGTSASPVVPALSSLSSAVAIEHTVVEDKTMYPFGHFEPLRETGIFAKPPPAQPAPQPTQAPATTAPEVTTMPTRDSYTAGTVISPQTPSVTPTIANAGLPGDEKIAGTQVFSSNPENGPTNTPVSSSTQLESESNTRSSQLDLLLAWLVFIPLVPLVGALLGVRHMRGQDTTINGVVSIAIGIVMTAIQVTATLVVVNHHITQQHVVAWEKVNSLSLTTSLQTVNAGVLALDQAILKNNISALSTDCSNIQETSQIISSLPKLPTSTGQTSITLLTTLLNQSTTQCTSAVQAHSTSLLAQAVDGFNTVGAYEQPLKQYT